MAATLVVAAVVGLLLGRFVFAGSGDEFFSSGSTTFGVMV